MEVTVLGSGTVTPVLERNASGLAVLAGGSLILVDMGPGTIRRMCEARIDSRLVDLIALTHFHPDHVSDLVPFLFASNYAFGPVRDERFHLIGPEGLKQFYESLVAVYDGWIVPTGNRLQITELSAGSPVFAELPGVLIRSAPSMHSTAGLAYRIEADGVSLTVTGDTDVSDDIAALARDTDLLVSECSLPEGMKVPGHLVPSEAGATAAKARAGRLLLTHLYPPCDDVDVVAQAAVSFDGEIMLARDLMTITV